MKNSSIRRDYVYGKIGRGEAKAQLIATLTAVQIAGMALDYAKLARERGEALEIERKKHDETH